MLNKYKGLLFIGDAHVASRVPGFRKDDYMMAILKKLEFALDYATTNHLLPVFLGDLFHRPRDNSNRLLTILMRILENKNALGITGNHDTTEKDLQDDDSLSVLSSANRITLIDQMGAWNGFINDIPVYMGGSTWSAKIPKKVNPSDPNSFVIWLTHHNIGFLDHEENWIKPFEIEGAHLAINGHIHRPMPEKICGMTTWLNPGSITRVQRADAVKDFVPSLLQITPLPDKKWSKTLIPVPHQSFEEVFFQDLVPLTTDAGASAFIQGLESLQVMKTESGAGLLQFIKKNLAQFDDDVSTIILNIVKEICPDEHPK